jgi:acyl-homoserine-lactone acylase
MKQSTRLEMADRFLSELLQAAAASTDADVSEARRVLAAWDRRTEADSRGALLFMAWGRLLLNEGDRAYAERWRADQPYTTPRGLADPSRAVDLLRAAAITVRKTYGSLDAPYGQGHRLRINGRDLPGSGGPGELGAYRNAYGKPGPDGVAALIGGDSFAAVVEFGERLRAQGILAYGTSTQPGSPHYGDQQTDFSANRLRPLWFYPQDVRANAASVERIR